MDKDYYTFYMPAGTVLIDDRWAHATRTYLIGGAAITTIQIAILPRAGSIVMLVAQAPPCPS